MRVDTRAFHKFLAQRARPSGNSGWQKASTYSWLRLQKRYAVNMCEGMGETCTKNTCSTMWASAPGLPASAAVCCRQKSLRRQQQRTAERGLCTDGNSMLQTCLCTDSSSVLQTCLRATDMSLHRQQQCAADMSLHKQQQCAADRSLHSQSRLCCSSMDGPHLCREAWSTHEPQPHLNTL